MRSSTEVLIICSRLDMPGGIERAIVNTANLLAEKEHEVTILILDETIDNFYSLNKKINLLQEALHFGITKKGTVFSRKVDFFQHIKKLKLHIDRINPNVIITTEYVFTITTWLATKGRKKILSWEHHHFYWLRKSKFWNYLFKRIYPKIERVICLNDKESELFNKAGCKTTVIPNFISQQQKAPLNTKVILSIGWLIKRKGVDLIPYIGEIVFQKFPEWKWKIIGSGEEYNNLKDSIIAKKLYQNIEIVKPQNPDLSSVYLNTSIYVMTSRFECFPMVLLEAMAYGVPCVSYNCPTGPADIIKQAEDGLLVENEDVTAMAAAICYLIEYEESRKEMGENAFKNILRFSPENIYRLWKVVLRQ